MIAKKFKTKMLGIEPTSSAHDLEIFPNSLDQKRVIFSFDSAEQRDSFTDLLRAAMRATGCWGGLEINDENITSR
jgi:hypothetical protein